MNPHGPRKDLRRDFGLIDDNAEHNQSAKLQKAIDTIAEEGGGRLFLPKGTYRLSEIYLKSNVHLLIEKDTVIKSIDGMMAGDDRAYRDFRRP